MEKAKTMNDPVLGELTWDATMSWWVTSVNLPMLKNIDVGIEPDPDLSLHISLLIQFKNWITSNHESFIKVAVDDLFEYDLIWPENFIKNADDLSEDEFEDATELIEKDLATKLKIHALDVSDGVVSLWLDTGGYTTDHLVQTKLNEDHEIIEMTL